MGGARDAVLEHAAGLPTSSREDLQLLVSEVVTNAVRHGGGVEGRAIILRVIEGRELLRVEVTDDGEGFERTTPTPRADGGWGLFFVDKLASRWDVELTEGGTRVWFEMDVPADGQHDRSRFTHALSA